MEKDIQNTKTAMDHSMAAGSRSLKKYKNFLKKWFQIPGFCGYRSVRAKRGNTDGTVPPENAAQNSIRAAVKRKGVIVYVS